MRNPLSGIAKPYQEEALRLLRRIQELKSLPSLPGVGYAEEIEKIQERLEALRGRSTSGAAWKTVQLARHPERPQTLDYIKHGVSEFLELHGDRLHGDDPAIVAGLGLVRGRAVAIIGHQKGHNLKERQARRFGMPTPEGFRKAQRVALLADKFGVPVITLVDTPGAHPGREAEEGGQAGAIARSMEVFARLHVPTVAVVIGEGWSGGALAVALCDRVLMLENAVYSVISPEGCAAILWRDASEAQRAADAMRFTADDLLRQGLIDGVVPEPTGGAHLHQRDTVRRVLREAMIAIQELERVPADERLLRRREKFLAMSGPASPSG